METRRRQRWMMAALWVAATAAVSGVVSWQLVRGGLAGHQHSWAQQEPEEVFHEWMHRHLKLTREQQERLRPHEEAFERERVHLREEIRAAGAELARKVREASEMTKETRRTLDRLSGAQRRLQEATLEHFYQMKAHLDGEQQARLLKWTQDSLMHDERHGEGHGHEHD